MLLNLAKSCASAGPRDTSAGRTTAGNPRRMTIGRYLYVNLYR